jgi:phospholipid-binding lipoprotein MlaA
MGMHNKIIVFCLLFIAVAATGCFAEDILSPCSFEIVAFSIDGSTALSCVPERETFYRERNRLIKEHSLYAQLRKPQWTIPEEDEDDEYLEEGAEVISDPLEPLNRVFFHFNDKLYFWIVKPAARGYSSVFPEGVRIAIRNFFNNINTPVRFVNNLLQLKIKSAGNELLRFGVNMTGGVLGLMDYAKTEMGLEMQDEDLGQTIGSWGIGPVFYVNIPVLGPSSFRDTIGLTGDYFLDPVNLVDPTLDRIAIKTGDRINKTSLSIGEYEELKKDALDPYIALRDIYYQYRKKKIEE